MDFFGVWGVFEALYHRLIPMSGIEDEYLGENEYWPDGPKGTVRF